MRVYKKYCSAEILPTINNKLPTNFGLAMWRAAEGRTAGAYAPRYERQRTRNVAPPRSGGGPKMNK